MHAKAHKKACARALATLSSPANIGDLALGAAALGAPAYAVEDVVEGTCAPPPEGERRVKGCVCTPLRSHGAQGFSTRNLGGLWAE